MRIYGKNLRKINYYVKITVLQQKSEVKMNK
jgi:hypothetical protein